VLKFMSAALAMAGLSGCDAVPEGKLVPGVRASENIIPGLPNYYAATHVLDMPQASSSSTRWAGSETLLRIRSLAVYIIGALESRAG
jgi:hypothetical protein